MKEDISKIISWAIKNPDKSVEEIMKEFKIEQNIAFFVICKASKKI